jgi:catechol 2,3-dioxygenase-like lactoylglutathione lyase family enzyme
MKKIVFLIVVVGLFVYNASAQTAKQLSKVSITVSSLEKLVPFYEEVLSFEKIAEYEWTGDPLQRLTGLKEPSLTARIALMQLGKEQIELIEFTNENRQLALPADSRSNDLWFQHIAIVVSDMEKAYAHLRAHKVQFVSTAPQTLPEYLPAAAGISAFYFRDPDGHNLEVIHFPQGKGKPKWQAPTDQLFLGI